MSVGAEALEPVYSGSPENERFFRATPSGSIQFFTTNEAAAKQLTEGVEYYVDIHPAAQAAPADREAVPRYAPGQADAQPQTRP